MAAALGDSSVRAALAGYGCTTARLDQGKAHEATELDLWLADYKAIAKVALDEHPQALERLGVLVKR